MEKTQIQLASTSNEYEAAIKALEETTGRWNREWKAACDVRILLLSIANQLTIWKKFQDLEEERIDFTKSSLWTFANVASTVCVSDDAVCLHFNEAGMQVNESQSCEKIRLSLESCEVEKDIASFIQESGTGQEIPDPPRYINFCRGELNDTASEISEDENYQVAQFQRAINPAFRSSSPQPSVFESHHDPKSDLAMRMGHQEVNTPLSRETTVTPQKPLQPPQQVDHRRQAQAQSKIHHDQTEPLPTVPHNEYPTEGMTMFCRTAPPSERSSAASPIRPSSRDSQSEYSNPTSFSSQEQASGKQSPIKQNTAPIISPTNEIQKKRSGFFSNSPFRRKSKHEKEGRENSSIPILAPSIISSNTWAPSSAQNVESRTSKPARSYARGNNSANSRDKYSGSPEPVDPRANFQLNVGPNVFDVASPDSNRNKPTPNPLNHSTKDLDPIAQALAELKGINKQSSVRMSADRYHGIATPAPPGTPGMSTPTTRHSDHAAAQRGTPPPSYHDQTPVKRLDLPKPAFTSAQMQQTTRKYIGQTKDMYGSSRPGTRNSATEIPRSTSPLPMRSVSPRPGYNSAQTQGQGFGSRASPNPQTNVGRSRQSHSTSPTKPGYSSASALGNYSRHNSANTVEREVSPQPQFARQERPNSSAGTMALQLSDGGNLVSQRGRGGTARPMSYYGGPQSHGSEVGRQVVSGERTRSKSAADGRKYTQDGRPILHFGKLPLFENLGFKKGVEQRANCSTHSSKSTVCVQSGYSRGTQLCERRRASCLETSR